LNIKVTLPIQNVVTFIEEFIAPVIFTVVISAMVGLTIALVAFTAVACTVKLY
jgi:hypothetical protein